MLDHLPLDLAHAIAARVDPETRESAFLAAPRLLPPTAATLELPPEAAATRASAAAWLRSPAASVRGLETRAVLRLHPATASRPISDREAVRAALEALRASGRRVAALELVSAAAAAGAAATGGATTTAVNARAFFEDAAALLGGSLREIAVRDVELVVVAAAEEATTTTAPPSPSPLLLLDSLELDGCGALGVDNLHEIITDAICPYVRSTERLIIQMRHQQQPPAPTTRAAVAAEQVAAACAALSRDALGRSYLREVEVLGLPFKDAVGVEEARRCILKALGGEGLTRLRLGLGSAGVAAAAAANANANASAATANTTTTASILEAEWKGDGAGLLNNSHPTSLSVHARVADPDAFAGALQAAAAAAFPAPTPTAAVESLTLLLAPAALDKDGGAGRLAALLKEMPRLQRLRLAVMATSTLPGGGGLLRVALRAVAAAGPPALAALEMCGGLASVKANDAVQVLEPLMAPEAANLRRSLRALKVAAAFVVGEGEERVGASASCPRPRPRLADALPSLRWLALNNLMVGSSGLAAADASSLPTLDVGDLPPELERLDVRGWALAEPALVAAGPRPSSAPLTRLSLRECSFSPASAARMGQNVTEVVLTGPSHAFWRRSEREADRLARAWPRLRSLAIGGQGGDGGNNALPALVAAAARRCPSLRELRLQGLSELDPRALALALRPAARTLRVLDVAAAANAADEGEEGEGEGAAMAATTAVPPPDAAGVARAVAPLEALRRLRVKAPGWRFDAGAALAAAIARPWMAVEAVCGPPPPPPRTNDARALAAAAAAMA